MPPLNWDIFKNLPGAETSNFEKLCRTLIKLTYGQYGTFKERANQPGVEFHLELEQACSLGTTGCWFGWQCKWYDLPKNGALGSSRRAKIEDGIKKTIKELPDLTDWVLWTRQILTKNDQEWFYGLKALTNMNLHLWSSDDIESKLIGEAELLRKAYFGELIIRDEDLADIFSQSLASVQDRWVPELYQITDVERIINKLLGYPDAWNEINVISEKLKENLALLEIGIRNDNKQQVLFKSSLEYVQQLSDTLHGVTTCLENGNHQTLSQLKADFPQLETVFLALLKKLRATKRKEALPSSNLYAYAKRALEQIHSVSRIFTHQMLAVVGNAGNGKTMLAIQLASPNSKRPCGLLLHGRDLHSGQNLNHLSQKVILNGSSIPNFETLVAALQVAGDRNGRRIPIVIDGLNEAEDPRNWKPALAVASDILSKYPNVFLICTIRSAFVPEALPDEINTISLTGFGSDLVDAVKRYFAYYKIKLSDVAYEIGILQHPLILKIFCEVTNKDRVNEVCIDGVPTSYINIFDKYIKQISERIAASSHISHRYYESDVRDALNKIGYYFWTERKRSVPLKEIRQVVSDPQNWDHSIVRALEHDGVLLRDAGTNNNENNLIFIYDRLAGYVIAESLFDKHADNFFDWVNLDETLINFYGLHGEKHPLNEDIFLNMTCLTPHKMHRRNLWQNIEQSLVDKALSYSLLMEKDYIDNDTTEGLSRLIKKDPESSKCILNHISKIRAAVEHPLNSVFLDNCLRPLGVAERDILWTEWLRHAGKEQIEVLSRLTKFWESNALDKRQDALRARWIMWTLTSTHRYLRDLATQALTLFGINNPSELFKLTIESLSINDPYITERMLSASYGVCLQLWKNATETEFRAFLPDFARELAENIYYPTNKLGSSHELVLDSSIGIINIATLLGDVELDFNSVLFPYKHLQSKFPDPSSINEKDISEATSAILTDFRNYTIGHLIPARRNYDFDNPDYKKVLKQIHYRILELGYDPAIFGKIDREIASNQRFSRGERPKVERYGKKYSWIAYFEMYGLRKNLNLIPAWRMEERIHEVGVDPSFPQKAKMWEPELQDIFSSTPVDHIKWLMDGPKPDFSNLLAPDEVDGIEDRWLLLNGHINQESPSDDREIFTFIRGLFVNNRILQQLITDFKFNPYPGNGALPVPLEDNYSYAAEMLTGICWDGNIKISHQPQKRPHDIRLSFEEYSDGRLKKGWPVEVPVNRFGWEGYHSRLNQVNGVTVLNSALITDLRLINERGGWDLYDEKAQAATLYREFSASKSYPSSLHYIRSDILNQYLCNKNKSLVWFAWGERGIHYNSGFNFDQIHEMNKEYCYIHKCCAVWDHKKNSILP